jgi:hypothetical protein
MKKWLKAKIPQSVELGYPQTVAPLFGSHHSANAFQPKDPSGLVLVHEP